MAKQTRNGGWAPEVTDELKEKMSVLIYQGYKSASNRHRIVIRIPPEFQGNARAFEAWCIDKYKEWSKCPYCNGPLYHKMSDKDVESHCVRVYGGYPYMKEHYKELTIDEYAAFRKAGGQTW